MASAIATALSSTRLFLERVAAAESLRDEAGRAGAQEIEGREHDVENDRAGGQPAEQRRVAERPTTAVSTRPISGVVR